MASYKRALWMTTSVSLIASMMLMLLAAFYEPAIPVAQAKTDCPAGYYEITKFESPKKGATTQAGVTIVVSADQQSFTFTSSVLVYYVYAKAGSVQGGTDTSNSYTYASGTYSGAGTTAPREISHITFCGKHVTTTSTTTVPTTSTSTTSSTTTDETTSTSTTTTEETTTTSSTTTEETTTTSSTTTGETTTSTTTVPTTSTTTTGETTTTTSTTPTTVTTNQVSSTVATSTTTSSASTATTNQVSSTIATNTSTSSSTTKKTSTPPATTQVSGTTTSNVGVVTSVSGTTTTTPVSNVAPITAVNPAVPAPVSDVAPVTGVNPAGPAPISQVAPATAVNTAAVIPATAPRTGDGFGAALAQQEAMRQMLWFGAILALLIAMASASGAILLPSSRKE